MDILLDTQMRAGTHYLLNALCCAYRAKAFVINRRTGKFQRIEYDSFSRGLLSENDNHIRVIGKGDSGFRVLQHHYYHRIAYDAFDPRRKIKKVYLIGYPFDSFYSDALLLYKNIKGPRPAQTIDEFGNYIFKYDSREREILDYYMFENSIWLKNLTVDDNAFILRYEDFYVDFMGTMARIQGFLGRFMEKFPKPRPNPKRCYFISDYALKFDKKVLDYIREIFKDSIQYFWPEKKLNS